MSRVTIAQLQNLIKYLNATAKTPGLYLDEKTRTTNVGHYCLSQAYGGVELQQVCNESGGVRDVLHTGHIGKKELFGLIGAYIRGIEAVLEK